MALCDISIPLTNKRILDSFFLNTKQEILITVNGRTESSLFHNAVGKLVHIFPGDRPFIGIQFDFYSEHFHNCRGRGKQGYCYYVFDDNIVSLRVVQEKRNELA